MPEIIDQGVMKTDSAKQLVAYIERIESLEEERANLGEDVKNEFLAAKSQGFDPKIMKVILKIRKRPSDEIEEEEQLVDTYRAALGMT
jgi:uncharacterized protein (UPF0335 family)